VSTLQLSVSEQHPTTCTLKLTVVDVPTFVRKTVLVCAAQVLAAKVTVPS